jgi:hypothetical protein
MSDSHDKAVAIEQVERVVPREGMSPLVAQGLAILKNSPNPETLRELLAVNREWEANEARKAYSAAIVALKRDLPTVIKRDATVDFTSRAGQRTFYRHASLAGVMDEITGALTQHGFSLTWHPSTSGQQVSVTCRLGHIAGHHEETTIAAPVDTSGNKSPAQGVASTITLLQRYTALALLGIATADMKEPEGEADPAPSSGDKIDTERNMSVVGRLRYYGRTREQAETFIGRNATEWTEVDCGRVKTWAKTPMGEEGGPEPPA